MYTVYSSFSGHSEPVHNNIFNMYTKSSSATSYDKGLVTSLQYIIISK